jgi:hypothetical protein
MQMVITFMAVVAGLAFSIAVALVVEELIFGQVFRILHTSKAAGQRVSPGMALQPVRVKSKQN